MTEATRCDREPKITEAKQRDRRGGQQLTKSAVGAAH